jgi:endonuclease/exonuclease/phosphatase family metal-dependent hydrolase
LLDSGTFWLSETPDVIASKSWDSALCRIATHATVRDKQSGRTIFVLNTHWDHQGAVARVESANLIAARVDEALRQGMSVIVTGDLNCTEASEGYALLARRLIDAFRAANPQKSGDEATFHNFRGTSQGQAIDFIFVSHDFSIARAHIDRTSREGRFPSDHFPVTAEMRVQSKRD